MRVVTALCSAVYVGRGSTTLDEAVRAIIIKDDGSVAIHNDVSNKPLNYMNSKSVFTETKNGNKTVWVFDGRKETLQIFITTILQDVNVSLDKGLVGLKRDGTENHLQEWLADNINIFGEGYSFGGREYPTEVGPVDILLFKEENPVVVEVKRVATPNSVYQVLRYVDALREAYPKNQVEGMVVALDLRPAMLSLAKKRGVDTLLIPSNWKELSYPSPPQI